MFAVFMCAELISVSASPSWGAAKTVVPTNEEHGLLSGQSPHSGLVRYYSVGNPSVGFRDDGVMFVVREPSDGISGTSVSESPVRSVGYLMRFEGARLVSPVGREELSFKSNFFFGNDPNDWRTEVPNYGEVVYGGLYDGITVVFHAEPRGVKYDIIVQPGADPAQITIAYDGVKGVDAAGSEIAVDTGLGKIRDTVPLSYQASGDAVSCRYEIRGLRSIGFRCSGWDRSSVLTIDPLVYSGFLGGSGSDYGWSIKVDLAGDAYVTGMTASVDFPTTPGSYDQTPSGMSTAFVTKITANGKSLIYSTYVGGNGRDEGYSIALDLSGNAYITGYTESSDFPTTPGAYDGIYSGSPGDGEVFTMKLNPTGSALVYSTFLGNGCVSAVGTALPCGLDVDPAGNAYVVGRTTSSLYPTTPGAYDRTHNGGVYDAFVTKLNASGDGLLYSTFLGGSDSDHATSVSIDSGGNAYVVGYAQSINFPTSAGAFQTSNAGVADVFVTKVNPTGSGLAYSTYIGSPDIDEGHSIFVDSSGYAYITGLTRHNKYPTTPGAYSTTLGGGASDAFVTKLNLVGTGLVYSTFLGGAGNDEGHSITVDSGGNASVTGETSDNTFPFTAGSYDTSYNGGLADIFLTKFNAAGSNLLYSTYIGGINREQGYGVAVHSARDAYVTGNSWSDNYPITFEAFNKTLPSGFPSGVVTRLVFNNNGPIANAGLDFPVPRNTIANLDGSASSDSDGDLLYYQWSQISGPAVTINNPTAVVAWIQPLSLGAYQFRLNVTDEYNAWSADTVIVTVINLPPVADAGPDANGYRNSVVTLDGRGSSDPNGDVLAYAWTQTVGPAFPSLNNPTSDRAWFTPPLLGNYSFLLNVSDGYGGWDNDTVNITVINRAPISNAGSDHTGSPNSSIPLDGSASYDPDGDPITYIWSQISGPSCTIINSTQAFATMTTQFIDVFEFWLEVRDNKTGWSLDRVNITVVNSPPVADAGPDQSSPRNTRVDLDGSASADSDGRIVTYSWSQVAGPGVTLNNANTVAPWFTPTALGVHWFRLTVTDDSGMWDTDDVNVTVINRDPTANAGSDASAFKRTVVTLNGTLSSDPDGDTPTFSWTQIGGLTVTLSGANTAKPTFTPAASGAYTFNLTVNDGFGGSAWDTVVVTVANRDPTANAGIDQTVAVNSVVTLDGSASSDPDGDPRTFAWIQMAGPVVALAGADTPNPTFTPTVTGVYVFQLRVTDDDGGSGTDGVTITVVSGQPPVADIKVWPGTIGYLGTVFVFDGANSTDPDGTVSSYYWTLGDGSIDVRSRLPHIYSSRGQFTVNLTVTDDDGMTNSTTLTIVVVNRPPEIVFVDPADQAVTVRQWETEPFEVVAHDPDGDVLTNSWRLNGTLVGSDMPDYIFNQTALTTYTVNITVSDGFLEDWYEWTVTVSPANDGDGNPPVESAFPWWIVAVVIVIVAVLILLLLMMKRRRKGEESTIPPKKENGKPPASVPPKKVGEAKPAAKPTAKPAAKPAMKPPAQPAVLEPFPAKTPAASIATPPTVPAAKPVFAPAAAHAPMLAPMPDVTLPSTAPAAQTAIPLNASSAAPAAVLAAKPAMEPPAMLKAKPEAESAVAPAGEQPAKPAENPDEQPVVPAKKEEPPVKPDGEKAG